MCPSRRVRLTSGATIAALAVAGVAIVAQGGGGRGNQNLPAPVELAPNNAMTNPYRMLEKWPHLGDIKAGADTFLQPAAWRATPDGNIVIADGHWPRPTKAPLDGDRLVWFTRDGKFLKEFGRHGRKPGEFMGPHGLAFDSIGRLFVADRSNNRIQIFDKDMNVVDEWKHFGRPSGIWILKDDTLIVSDSESNQRIGGADDAPEGGGEADPQPGRENGHLHGNAEER